MCTTVSTWRPIPTAYAHRFSNGGKFSAAVNVHVWREMSLLAARPKTDFSKSHECDATRRSAQGKPLHEHEPNCHIFPREDKKPRTHQTGMRKVTTCGAELLISFQLLPCGIAPPDPTLDPPWCRMGSSRTTHTSKLNFRPIVQGSNSPCLPVAESRCCVQCT